MKAQIETLGFGRVIDGVNYVKCVIKKDGLVFDGFISTGYRINWHEMEAVKMKTENKKIGGLRT